MRLELRYGHGVQEASLDGFPPPEERRAPLGPPTVDEEQTVARAVESPVAERPLREAARGARRVAILISGKDRLAGARVYLPVLLRHLHEAGVPEEGIEIVCATGTHARHTPAEVEALIGEDVAARIRFRAHDCDRPDGFVDLGRTSRGTPVLVDRGILEADLRILTGLITHHYFAGYSGGRKSILPGVSARATILANHRRVLDEGTAAEVHPEVFGGNLVGNPVHEDMVEAARRVGPVWILNTLLDGRHRISHAFAGELEEAHLAGCRQAERLFFFEDPIPAPLVLASAGGYPFDLNLIQGVKALFNHRDAVMPGGVFILVAEAKGGILRGMKEWMGWADSSTLAPAMASGYDLAAHNSLMLRQILARFTVVLVSALPAEEVRALGFQPAPSLQEAMAMARWTLGRGPELRVIHDGNVTQTGGKHGRIGQPGGAHASVQAEKRAS